MFKILAIALVFLNVFAAGHMRAEAHMTSSGGAPHHVHANHQLDTVDADGQHQSEQNIGYNCCVGAALHCGASIMTTQQFVPHGLFQLALEHAQVNDPGIMHHHPASDPPPPKS